MQALKRYYKVIALPLFEDNYSYIISGTAKKCLVLVDPANPTVVMNYLTTNFPQHIISHVLYTHKHWDHAGGSEELSQKLLKVNPNVKIVIGQHDKPHVQGPNYSLPPNEELKIGHSTVKTVHVPCHTRGHTIFSFLPLNQSFLEENEKIEEKTMEGKQVKIFASHSCTFTGDTLFVGGIGRFFQGNAIQMTQNIDNIYKNIDLDSDVFCGHQYALANLSWGMKVEQNNTHIQQVYSKLQQQRKQKGVPCSIPSSLRQQKDINVFVRAVTGSPLQQSIEKDPSGLMKILREMKNKNLTNYTEAKHLL